MFKLTRVAIVVGIVLFSISCANKAEQIVEKMIAAHNSHNVEEEISFYAENAKYEEVGWGSAIEGKEKIRKRLSWDAAVKSKIIVTNSTTKGDTVILKLCEIADWNKALGIDTTYVEWMRIIINDGLMNELKIKVTEASSKRYQKTAGAVIDWAKAERPDLLEDLKSKKREGYIANEETAPKWLHLAREWQKSKKSE